MKKLVLFLIVLFVSAGFSHAFAQDAQAYQNQVIAEPDTSTGAEITQPVIVSPEESVSVSSEEETDPVVSRMTSALSQAPQNESSKKAILDAQDCYKQAYDAYKKGDFDTAQKQFGIFMEKMKKAEIDSALYYFLSDDFARIFAKLDQIYSIDSSSGAVAPSFPMECPDNTLVDKYIKIYSGSAKDNTRAALERSGAYRDMILKNIQAFGLPKELLYLPIVESLFSNNDTSSAGAAGLWQIVPSQGRAQGLQINYWIDERKDPEKATKAACMYLKELYFMLNDWQLVLAAYNMGEYGLIRDMKFSNAADITQMTSRNAIPKETQAYVPQFIAVVTIANDLEKYGFTDLNYAEPIKYDVYKTDKVIDLKIAAQCAETTVEEIRALNPALKAWCTPQGYPGFELKIPYGSKEKFLANIASVKDLNPSPGFIKYKVVKGDYVEKIAKRYATTPQAIKQDNPQLKKQKYLRLGQVLLIRPGRQYFK